LIVRSRSLSLAASKIAIDRNNLVVCEVYYYLGFLVTPDGIDFVKHIQTRFENTLGYARFISI
jgi:hypothetical protein